MTIDIEIKPVKQKDVAQWLRDIATLVEDIKHKTDRRLLVVIDNVEESDC